MTDSVKTTIERLAAQFSNALTDPLLFGSEVDELDVHQVTAIHLVLKYLSDDVFKKRLAQTRTILLEDAEEGGLLNDSRKSFVLDLGDCLVIHETKEAKLPDENKVRELLQAKDIKIEAVFDPITTYELNPSKLESLVVRGKISKEEAAALYPAPSSALKVHERSETKALLSEMLKLAAIPEMEGTAETSSERREKRQEAKLQAKLALKKRTG